MRNALRHGRLARADSQIGDVDMTFGHGTARIVGRDVAAADAMEIHSPYDGELLGTVDRCLPADMDVAVQSAVDTMRRAPVPAWERALVLEEAAARLRQPEMAEGFARTISLESAKPIRTARTEVERAADTFTFSAVEARTLGGSFVPLDASKAGAGKIAFVRRVPLGVVGAITPFNFPLNLVAHKVGPALAAGCAVVVKPADQTPFTCLQLHDLLRECGLPEGWMQVVTGSGPEAGMALVEHPDVAALSFTGSTAVGWEIEAKARRKRVALELGGNAPVIIAADGDYEAVAAKISVAGFSHAGQSCISVQRVLVDESIADPFLEILVKEVGGLVVGPPLEESTDVSSVVNAKAAERIDQWLAAAIDAGAVVHTGGGRAGNLIEPTVLVGGPAVDACAVWTEEVFAPVVMVRATGSLNESIALANATRYGLQAGLFTRDIAEALTAAESLEFGGVLSNEVPTWRADQMPYGGIRESGNTREGPAWAVREFTEERLTVLSR